jgi:hypothetical protein
LAISLRAAAAAAMGSMFMLDFGSFSNLYLQFVPKILLERKELFLMRFNIDCEFSSTKAI